MKTIQLIAVFLLFVFGNVSAVVRTVSNDPAGGAQYTNLHAAYVAAANGDTLMLEGTNIDYSLISGTQWAKSLTVIGIGFNPQKQNAKLTRIANASANQTSCCSALGFEILNGGSNSKFYGIYFVSPNGVYTAQSVSNLTFEDCRFNAVVGFFNQAVTNIIFRNCIFEPDNIANVNVGGTANAVTNINFTSCVFDGIIDGSNNPFVTMFIDNCLFLSTTVNCFTNLRYSTISDCIFMNRFPGGTTDCTFLNNLCRVAGTFPPAGVGNSAANNIEATDPMFTTYTLNTLYSSAYNFNLLPGSPAIGAGTSGSDIGPHGSGSGFSRFGEVLINPIIRQVIIQNPAVSPNGTLNVDINASRPNDN